MERNFLIKFYLIFKIILILALLNCSSIYRSVKHDLEERYKSGLKEYRNGKYKEAIKDFEYIISVDPDFSDAKRFLDSSLKESVRKVESLYSEAKLFLNHKQPVEALLKFRLAEKLDPNYKDIKNQIRELLKNEKVLKEENRLIAKGNQEFVKKNYLKARQDYDSALILNYDNAEAGDKKSLAQEELDKMSKEFFTLGEKHFQQNQLAKANIEFKKAVEYNPAERKYLEAQKRTDTIIINSAYYDRGVSEFNKKKFLDAYLHFSYISGEYKDSSGYFRKAKSEAQNHISGYIEEGKVLYNENKLKEAIQIFDHILALDPSQTEAEKYKEQAEKKFETLKSFE